MRRCKQCIIPENFPGVSYNQDGVCNFCTDFKKPNQQQGTHELTSLLTHNPAGDYDCLVCYSGGKDSTYTLKTLVQDYKLRVMAFTFDHGFTSPQALANIEAVTGVLGVEKIIFRPDPELLKKIFKTTITYLPDMPPESIYGRGMREYGPVCYICGCMIHSVAMKLSLHHNIPLIVTGYTPTQDPAYYKGYTQKSDEPVKPTAMSAEPWLAISKLMYKFLSSYEVKGHEDLLLENVSPSTAKKLSFLRLFDFIKYDEEYIYSEIEKLGWKKPLDTDSCSTNCLLNGLGIYIYEKVLGYHPYTKQMADLIRMGLLDRDKALSAVGIKPDPDTVAGIAGQLGVKL